MTPEKGENMNKHPEVIDRDEIMKAQEIWGMGVVEIGKEHSEKGDYLSRAKKHVEELYAYDLGKVLFKPTKAAEKQFRGTLEGAVSYFVGGNEKYPEDHGFATEPWSKVRFENTGVIEGSQAMAMGNYYFTGPDGNEVKVEYTFGYIRDEKGGLRINVHHSSLPFNPEH